MPQLFGRAAYLIPLALGVLGWTLFWCKPVEAPYTKAFGLLALLLGALGLPGVGPGRRRDRRGQGWGTRQRGRGAPGGAPSASCWRCSWIAEAGRTGALIVVCAAIFVALILTMQFSFAAVLRVTGPLPLDSHP